jgi:tetratricopeptide (TPR) repeat protein
MTDSSDFKELLQRGQAAARVGRRAEARDMLRRAVALVPGDPAAWLALAGVEDDPAAKIACFEKVLALDPQNVEARLGLEMLRPPAAAVPSPSKADDDLEAVLAEASRRLEAAVGAPLPGEVPLDDAPARQPSARQPAAAARQGQPVQQAVPAERDVLYCANHPNVETMLRCNRCGKPICTRCAVQTPVGYRCKQCVAGQQAVFYTGGAIDYVVSALVALLLGGVAALLMSLLSYWFFALILGAPIGIGIAEAVRFAVRRRRSKYLWLMASGGIVVGALPALFLSLLGLEVWSLLAMGLYLVLAVGAAAARLR